MATNFSSSNIINWYGRINRVRIRVGAGSITMNSKAGKSALASDITDIKTNINNLKSNSYLKLATFTTTDSLSVSAGNNILEIQKAAIESTLSSLETICNQTVSVPCRDTSNRYYCSDNYNETGHGQTTYTENYNGYSNAGSCQNTGAQYSNDRYNYVASDGYGDGYRNNCYHASNVTGYGDKICSQDSKDNYSSNAKNSTTRYSNYSSDWIDNGYSQNTNATTSNSVTGNSYTPTNCSDYINISIQ